jgi:sugar (pentulose or hexulose) kinase
MLFDEKGNLLAKAKECFDPYFSQKEGFAEQQPELYWQKLCSACQSLKAERKDIWENLAGMSVTCMRDVSICVDENQHPLRPCILWLDRRKAKCESKLPAKTRFIFKLAGMTSIAEKLRKECKSNWIRENEPEIWQKTHKYIQLSAFLTYKLCGKLRDGFANTIGHIPFDYRKKDWMGPHHFQAPVCNIERDKLYPLVNPSELFGEVTAEAAKESGIPEGLALFAAGSDKGCETLGTGSIYAYTANVSFGTTATIQVTTQKYVEPITFLPAYPAVYPHRYNPEVMVTRGYWMLTWFVKEFLKKDPCDCYEQELDKQIENIPPCCEGLYVEPYWGASMRYPESRGAIIGFTESHTMLHVYRAMIEGISFSLYKGLLSIEKKSGVKIKRVSVSGGGARSDTVCQITADIFGLPVVRAQTYETSGLGAAICAFAGLGVYKDCDEAMQNMVRITKEFRPNPDNHALYKDFYDRVYADSFKKLKPIFRSMKNHE